MSIHQPDNKCPKCGSSDVEVGNVVLSCLACDWTLIGEHPCDVCGEPAVGASGAAGVVHYRCRQHPLSVAEMRELIRPFAEAVLKDAPDPDQDLANQQKWGSFGEFLGAARQADGKPPSGWDRRLVLNSDLNVDEFGEVSYKDNRQNPPQTPLDTLIR